MCIVTGPRIELAITLIDRMKGLFTKGDSSQNHAQIVCFTTKETVIELNGCHIEAYPSHHLDSMRGLTNISFIVEEETTIRIGLTIRDSHDATGLTYVDVVVKAQCSEDILATESISMPPTPLLSANQSPTSSTIFVNLQLR